MKIGTDWSTQIQPISVMDNAREQRYAAENGKKLFSVLPNLVNNKRILDVGCGTGAFTRSLYRYLSGKASISGIDTDEQYIKYAKGVALHDELSINYTVGDALNINSENAFYDIVMSSSVINHVEPDVFLNEQIRVLKEKGLLVCMVIAGYKSIQMDFFGVLAPSEREKELKEKALNLYMKSKYEGRWRLFHFRWNELLEKLISKGLKECHMEIVKLTVVPDNTLEEDGFLEKQLALFENELSMIEILQNYGNTEESENAQEYYVLLNNRIQKRIEMYKKNKCLWDYCETELIVAYGQKDT